MKPPKNALRQLRSGSGFAVLAILALLLGCAWPTRDQATLKAIKAEAQALMTTHTGRAYATIPKSRWPRAIAALRPETVTIYEDGINILMKPEFDGG